MSTFIYLHMSKLNLVILLIFISSINIIKAQSGLDGKLLFNQQDFNLGDINHGMLKQFRLKFQNISSDTLSIISIESNCLCITSAWPRQFILPGKKNEIILNINPKSLSGRQYYLINIFTSLNDSAESIHIEFQTP